MNYEDVWRCLKSDLESTHDRGCYEVKTETIIKSMEFYEKRYNLKVKCEHNNLLQNATGERVICEDCRERMDFGGALCCICESPGALIKKGGKYYHQDCYPPKPT